MPVKTLLGATITIIGLLLFIYAFFYVAITQGAVGVKGQVTADPIIGAAGFLMILIGPALWFGEVPVNIKKLIEAKTGRKV
jgi:hypothetical protein